MKRTNIDATQLELADTVVAIKRVSKTVKGGRTMRFSALVVVGDKNGHVGVGMGKAAEIPEAIRKGKQEVPSKRSRMPCLIPAPAAITRNCRRVYAIWRMRRGLRGKICRMTGKRRAAADTADISGLLLRATQAI